jgi:exoribonuclease R
MTTVLCTKNYKEFTVSTQETDETIATIAGAKNVNKCLPGDCVTVTETGCVLQKRAQHRPIAGLIELNSKVKYGFTSRNTPIYLFTPFNEAYPPFIVGCSERDTSINRLALITFDTWTDTYPRGLLRRLLDTEEEALFWTHSPAACEKYKGPIPAADPISNRRLLPQPTFHIDPVGCVDVDDVLTLESLNDRTYVTITIADVAHVIHPSTSLDIRAAAIAQTFYQPTSNKPMFPRELSEDLLSLKPSSTHKAGLSLRFPLDDPSQVMWFESAVPTTTTYTYESVYKNQDLCAQLKQMASALNEPTDDSHVWIEIAMKFYNTEAAKMLKAHNTGLLRCHKAPDKAKLDKYMQIDPALKFLAYTSATYVSSEENTGHWGLSAEAYCHASSPIRRYADLINQRALKAILNKTSPPACPSPHNLNRVAKAAKQHDRDYIFMSAIRAAPSSTVSGQIVTIKPTAKDTTIAVYVSEWSLIVKLHYTPGPEPDTVVSKDETQVFAIKEGQQVVLAYSADLKARSWKKRMVLRLTQTD